jgi:GWxTD domain-containing protein
VHLITRNIFLFLFPVIVVLVACWLFDGCATKKATTPDWNMTNIYNPGSVPLHPLYTVYHTSDSVTLLMGKIYTAELLLNQANPTGKNLGYIKVNYQMVEIVKDMENKAISDSATFTYPIEASDAKKIYYFSRYLKASKGKKYKLTIFTTDALRQVTTRNYLIIDRLSDYSSQNFRVVSHNSGFPLFEPYVDTSDVFSVQFNQKGIDKLFVKYFKKEMPLPAPAFFPSANPLKELIPDSVWEFPYTGSKSFGLKFKGMYLFQVDTARKEGLTLFHFGVGYPKILIATQMLPPLEYLTRSTEMEAMKKAENKKIAIDKFWLNCAGNMEIARELIRVYYNRVFFANYYFTADREGWKTDQGMIYIIYGLPDNMTKTATEEVWTYYNRQGPSLIAFTFRNIVNPFSNNYYELVRNESTVTFWRQAVDSWRSGRVFNMEE